MESNKCTFAPGIHAVEIKKIVWARDYKNQIIDNTIRVEYIGANGNYASEIIPLQNQWITDNLIKCCKLDNRTKEIPVTEMIGKRLWIYVRGYYNNEDKDVLNEVAPLMTEPITGKYSAFFGPKPSHIDDPEGNNGFPGEYFCSFVDTPLPEDQIEDINDREFGDD